MDKMPFGPHVPWIEGKNGSWDNSDLGWVKPGIQGDFREQQEKEAAVKSWQRAITGDVLRWSTTTARGPSHQLSSPDESVLPRTRWLCSIYLVARSPSTAQPPNLLLNASLGSAHAAFPCLGATQLACNPHTEVWKQKTTTCKVFPGYLSC